MNYNKVFNEYKFPSPRVNDYAIVNLLPVNDKKS
jgi:hypothetical protein